MTTEDYDLLIFRGIYAFLVHLALGGICYLTAFGAARLISSVPQGVYIFRLVFMLIIVLVWWNLDFPLHRHYNGTPFGWGIEIGNRYGMHTIWVWLVLALVGRPKKRDCVHPPLRLSRPGILIISFIGLAAIGFCCRWALLPFLSPPQGIYRTSWTYADLVRDRYPFHFIDPTWLRDDFLYWGLTESAVRLGVIAVFAAVLVICFTRFRRQTGSVS
jgi:hypothetical protein